MTEFTQQGGCLCGAVRYRTTRTPFLDLACHCTTCKLRTGAGYGIGVYFDDSQVEFLQGELNTHQLNSDTSGRWIRNEFCPGCGTTVSWTLEMRPGLRGVAGGTYDDPNWFELKGHIWTRSARPDMCYADDVALFEKAYDP